MQQSSLQGAQLPAALAPIHPPAPVSSPRLLTPASSLHPTRPCPCAAVSLLPRIDQLWYKYIHMEEMLGNVAGARQIFERWMAWEPDHHGWMAYIKVGGWGGVCVCV